MHRKLLYITKILTYEFSYFFISCYYRSRRYAMPTKDVIPFPAGPLPCVNIAATCPACGSLTLTAHRYCVTCERMIQHMDGFTTASQYVMFYDHARDCLYGSTRRAA